MIKNQITLTVILFIVSLVAETATNEIDLTEKELFRITTPDHTVSAVWMELWCFKTEWKPSRQ
jgi:hypothetical protein